jgi:glucokinase
MAYFAGFDLGGTQLKYGLVDDKARISFEGSADTPDGMAELFSLLESCWEELSRGSIKPIQAAGFGFPGIFDQEQQRIIQSPNYPSIDNIDLSPRLDRFIDIPVWINNDANMAAYGEFKTGAGQGVQSVILLTIGTGVGSGIILQGELWQGVRGFAGELGHVTVNPDGDKCRCGSRGCLETEVSSLKIIKNYQSLSGKGEDITSEDIFRLAKERDESALAAFLQAGKHLGIGLSALINLFNPEKILLGGGVMRAGDVLLCPAKEEARFRSYDASFNSCQIERATLGNRAGFIGCALWARDRSLMGKS